MAEIRTAGADDLRAITDIYNDAVMNSTSTFHTEPRTDEEQRRWFESHGVIREAGRKFGRTLDVLIMQKLPG